MHKRFPLLHKYYLLLAAVFITPRLVYWLAYVFFPDKVNADHLNHYWILSESLIREGRLVLEGARETTQIEPLYPVFIAAARILTGDSVAGVLLCQILFAFVGYIYFYKLCRVFLKDSKVAFIAGVIYSVSPYFIRSSVKIIEVPFFRSLLVIAVYYALESSKGLPQALRAGFFWGLALLTRSMILPAFLALAVKLVFERKIREAAVFFLSGFLVCAPMLTYNHSVDGSFFPTRGGVNFFLGNCKYYSRVMPLFHVDNLEGYAYELLAKERPDLVNASDRRKDQFFYQKSFDFIKNNFWRFLKYKALNISYFFSTSMLPIHPLGSSSIFVSDEGKIEVEIINGAFPARGALEILAHSFFRGFILMFSVLGVFMKRKQLFLKDLVFTVLFFNFLGVYTLFWPSTRLYAPVMFVPMIYAAYALMKMLSKDSWIWHLIPERPCKSEGVGFLGN